MRHLLLILMVVGLGLAGCGGDSSPTEPITTATPPDSASSMPTEPTTTATPTDAASSTPTAPFLFPPQATAWTPDLQLPSPTLLPVRVADGESVTAETICLEVTQNDFTDTEPVYETVSQILRRAGFAVVEVGSACDATLSIRMTFQALGANYYEDGGKLLSIYRREHHRTDRIDCAGNSRAAHLLD